MIVPLNVQEHEQVGAAKFWMGQPISACRSLAMRRGWEQAREVFEMEQREEQRLWAREAQKTAVGA